MPSTATLASPVNRRLTAAAPLPRVGSALRASISDGRRQRGQVAVDRPDAPATGAATAACTARRDRGGVRHDRRARAYAASGASPAPAAAFAASTSSGPVGSPSRRRLPNTRNAIAIVTPPVATTVGGSGARQRREQAGRRPRRAGPRRPGRRRRGRRTRHGRGRSRRGPEPPSPGPVEPGSRPAVIGSSLGDGLGRSVALSSGVGVGVGGGRGRRLRRGARRRPGSARGAPALGVARAAAAVGLGVGFGVGLGVGFGVGLGVASGVGAGLTVTDPAAERRLVALRVRGEELDVVRAGLELPRYDEPAALLPVLGVGRGPHVVDRAADLHAHVARLAALGVAERDRERDRRGRGRRPGDRPRR